MGTPAITTDAAGITETTARKTSGVVDKLIAPDAVAGDDRIVHIPTAKVVPHPRNRKIHDEDVADLLAAFKSGVPILNALGVTAAADWNEGKPDDLKAIKADEFIITAGGHRRLRAAELAGLKTVPCIVRSTFAGAEGRKAALLENLQRLDLDPFEEAEAFSELTGEYKVSQRDLAAGVGCNQSHVSKRLKLLKLPSLVRERVRLGQLTLADAIALAGVVDNKPVFEAALTMVNEWRYSGDQAVKRAQREHDEQVAYDRKVAELSAAGVPLLKSGQHPQWYPSGRSTPTRIEGLKLNADKHATEPCHAAYLDHGNNVILLCATPGNHLKAGSSALKLSKSVETEVAGGRSGSDAAVRRERNDLKKLWPGRAAIARQIVHRQVELEADVERELVARGTVGLAFHGEGRADTWKVARDFAMPVEPFDSYPNEEATDELIRRLPRDAVARLMALTYFECRIRSHYKTWGTDGRFYLDLLTQHGYTLNHLETKKLGKPKADRAPQQCDVCKTTEADFAPGVTWISPNVCSGCADAQENGWVACLDCDHGEPREDCDCTHCFCAAEADEPTTAEAVSA